MQVRILLRGAKKKARPRGARPALKINYKVMKKRFIQKSDLGEIMETLTETAMKYAGKMDLTMRVHSWIDDNVLSVRVTDNAQRILKDMDYVIVDELDTWDMIVDDTISDAISILEKQEEAKKAREEGESTTDTK